MLRIKLPTLGRLMRTVYKAAPRSGPAPISREIVHDTTSCELVCIHEAGHAAAAIAVGASIAEIVIYEQNGAFHARTRVDRDDDQAKLIVLGGFAAELKFFKAGRLRNIDRTMTTNEQFLDRALDHAREDLLQFVRLYFGYRLSDAQQVSPSMKQHFAVYAEALAESDLPIDAVERIAVALRDRRDLKGADIVAAFRG